MRSVKRDDAFRNCLGAIPALLYPECNSGDGSGKVFAPQKTKKLRPGKRPGSTKRPGDPRKGVNAGYLLEGGKKSTQDSGDVAPR